MSPAAFVLRNRVAFAALGASAVLHAAVIGGWPATVRLLQDTGQGVVDVSLVAEPSAVRVARPAAPRPKRASPARAGEAIARMPLLGEGDAPDLADSGTSDSPPLLAGEDVPDIPEKIAMAAPAAPVPALEIPAFPTRALPSKVSISYALSSIFADGRAEYTWKREGDRYEINGEMEAVGFFTVFLEGRILQQSRGTVTADGLRPERFVEYKPGSPEEGLTFDWERHTVTFSRNAETKEGPLNDNTVDWLSMIFQLAHLPPASERFDMRVFTQRKLYVFTLQSLGIETIEIPLGTVQALHLRHTGQSPDETVDVWLGVDQQFLPVKLRYPVARNRFMVEQVATSITAR